MDKVAISSQLRIKCGQLVACFHRQHCFQEDYIRPPSSDSSLSRWPVSVVLRDTARQRELLTCRGQKAKAPKVPSCFEEDELASGLLRSSICQAPTSLAIQKEFEHLKLWPHSQRISNSRGGLRKLQSYFPSRDPLLLASDISDLLLDPTPHPRLYQEQRTKQKSSGVNTNIIPKAIGVINGFNECANLFQWVASAMSSWKSQRNGSQKATPHGDVLQLQLKSEDVQQLQSGEVQRLESDLECLRDTLPAMYNLIDRAEWRSHDNIVADLLPKLKHAVYDAEDLLEEFRYHELKISAEGNRISVEPIINFFHSVIHGSFNKVTDIQKRLDSLSSQLEIMRLHQSTPRFDKSARPETTSLPIERMFGRDKELKVLISGLCGPVDSSGDPSRRKRTRSEVNASASNQVCTAANDNGATIMTSVSVLPIVGIGGVGKTTLAQNICNHPQVKSHFDKIIWICVSDDFDIKRLTKEAIEQSSGRAPTSDNLNCLQGTLENMMKEKRALIVLDDMWDDALKENGQRWKRFCAPFTNVPQGSMMLVTTRSPEVAKLVGTMKPFPLEGLKDDVFWDFFKQCVFGFSSSNIDLELERIGRTILPKLRGSPLAAKTLGRLLGMSYDTTHWNNILKSELWELTQEETDILPALQLSYMYLPFHLKRCFSFCAVYPKDHVFEKAGLAEIWAAEGFVAPQGNTPLQDIGSLYFEELVNRSFFQNVRSNYVIHDLMHDMAQLVTKDECFIINNSSDIQRIPKNVRHLSILPKNNIKCSDLSILDKHTKLRTLFCKRTLSNKTATSILSSWCAEFCCMRVLCFSQIRELPESISNMKHLRYFEILKKCHHFKSFPSVGGLYNLKTVYAKKCEFDNISIGFGMLFSLQRFESSGYQADYTHSDEGMNRIFRLYSYNGEYLPREFYPETAKANVTSLTFADCDKIRSISFPMNSQQVHSYASIDRTFSSLIWVKILSCDTLSSLDGFLQAAYIPAVKKMEIADCRILESVPTERFGDFQSLEELKVGNCPKIKSQRLWAPSLKKLELDKSGNIAEDIECNSLTVFHLSRHHLASIQLEKWNLPVLQELKISFCQTLTCIKVSDVISADVSNGADNNNAGMFPLLTQLTIERCNKLESLDDEVLYLPAIKSISIKDCGSLSRLPLERLGSSGSLEDLFILDCPCVNWQSGIVLSTSLRELKLQDCGDFSAWFPRFLENLRSLKKLELCQCEHIESIPGHLWSSNLASLQRLYIYECPNLVSIGGREDLAQIGVVLIRGCPKLHY